MAASRASGLRAALAGAVALAVLGGAGPANAPAARDAAARGCRVPQLSGLTLAKARRRAARAGCKLVLRGAKLERPEVQTVQRQVPRSSRHAARVSVWLNPACFGSAAYGPEIEEPTVTPGPTELLSGFYVRGGPAMLFSRPGCKRPEPEPGAGTVEVLDASGAVVATGSSTAGRLVQIPLAPGSYTIRGTFASAEINDTRPKQTEPLTIRAGSTVRQDFFLDVP